MDCFDHPTIHLSRLFCKERVLIARHSTSRPLVGSSPSQQGGSGPFPQAFPQAIHKPRIVRGRRPADPSGPSRSLFLLHWSAKPQRCTDVSFITTNLTVILAAPLSLSACALRAARLSRLSIPHYLPICHSQHVSCSSFLCFWEIQTSPSPRPFLTDGDLTPAQGSHSTLT